MFDEVPGRSGIHTACLSEKTIGRGRAFSDRTSVSEVERCWLSVASRVHPPVVAGDRSPVGLDWGGVGELRIGLLSATFGSNCAAFGGAGVYLSGVLRGGA